MNQPYSFLNDELALLEIRKHKWIESQKRGEEVGFPSAALDWIEKHGADWKKYRSALGNSEDFFTEKRIYRRFDLNLPLNLVIEGEEICSYTDDINLIGFSCTLPNYYPEETLVNVTINLRAHKSNFRMSKFKFRSKILRISSPREDSANLCFKAVIPFSEELRDFIRTNQEIVTAA